METANDRRLRKLSSLVREHGLRVVAEKGGVSQAYLDQIIKRVPLPPKKDGTRSPRNVGDRLAADLERGLGLPAGWFDADEPGEMQAVLARLALSPDAQRLGAELDAIADRALRKIAYDMAMHLVEEIALGRPMEIRPAETTAASAAATNALDGDEPKRVRAPSGRKPAGASPAKPSGRSRP